MAAIAISVAAPAYAQQRTYAFDIPAQDLSKAVRAFAKTTRQQVSFNGDQLRGKQSTTVKGQFGADAALQQLLQGTGVAFRRADRGVIVLVPSAVGNASAAGEAASSMGEDVAEDEKGVAEILILGKRSQNVDVRRTEDDPQPYVVFSQKDIEQSQATNLEDFIRARLTSNTTQAANAQQNNNFGNQSSINLRGLGTNQTLILVNGRRVPGINNINSGGDLNQPDVNGIPLAAIERIEVLPTTASGIYGGSATGGVVNIILRTDYKGLEVGIRYESPFDFKGHKATFDFFGGIPLEGGRTSINVRASLSRSSPLKAGDRDFAILGRELLQRNVPGAVTSGVVTRTPTIYAWSGANLVLKSGPDLGSPFTYIPRGYPGTASDGGAALIANAGKVNLELPAGVEGRDANLLNNPRVTSFGASIRREFSDSLTAYVDFGTYSNEGRLLSAAASNFAFISASAPNNPFTDDLFVTYPHPNLKFETIDTSKLMNVNAGAILRLPKRWSLSVDGGFSRTKYKDVGVSPSVNFDFFLNDNDIQNGIIDVLKDVEAFPVNYGPYLLPSPNSIIGPNITKLTTLSARLGGPIFKLPGGDVYLTTLLERREEKAEASFVDNIDIFNNFTPTIYYFPDRSQRVYSAYAELKAPILSDRPFVHELLVQGSVRHDRYRTRSVPTLSYVVPSRDGPLPDVDHQTNEVHSTDVTIALKYAPSPDVYLRASYGTGFLPPSIAQIAEQTINSNIFVTDPKRGNLRTLYQQIPVTVGGSPDLRPEQSKSWSLGVVATPTFLPGLRISFDYTAINKDDEIRSLSSQAIVDLEDVLSGRVTRGPLEPNAPPGFTAGPIIGLNQSLVNVAHTKVRALDFQGDYDLDLGTSGKLHFYAVATRQLDLERRTTQNTATVESVGFLDGPLKWRANGGATWTHGPITLGWNTQYYDSYKIYASTANQSSINFFVRRQGSARIRRQNYSDVYLSYDFDGGILDKTKVALGVQNIFNQRPPTIAETFATGGYSPYGDPRLRRFSISVRKGF
jgi:outer membrane receptor protein involved in Fe transport